ncbi:hypothetical protein P8452_38946 [Trifolium repens]|nr:hypothetical protein P8452_38946 [Trifolium repens]
MRVIGTTFILQSTLDTPLAIGVLNRFMGELKFERDELCDMIKQLMESLNFQPKPYTREQVHEDDVVDDNEDIVDNNDDNKDVVDNNDDNSDDNSDDNDGMSDDDELE